jgi:hypothetical protein
MLKIKIILFFVFMGLFSIAFQIGVIFPINDDEANSFVQEFLSKTGNTDAMQIITNNLSIALPMFVPSFGVAWGLYSAWSTGFGFAALLYMAPGLVGTEPLGVFYWSPYGFMELVAYSIGLSCSTYLTYRLIKRTKLKSLIKPTLIEIGIVIGLLVAGGYLEEYMIKAAQVV